MKLLFLCTGNSCRSIIAEALANHLGGGRICAFSAGRRPTGQVHPHALAVLAHHGVAVGEPVSKSTDDLEARDFDTIVTVCDAAAGESCPVWLADAAKAHWGVPDPALASGADTDIEAAFEATYQRLRRRIEALLALDLEHLSALELNAALQQIHRDAGSV